ncbi:MAG TPA: hypothetical protein VMY40_05995 [Anaerolineae bacterium]|nr:hypothetical protein [Anaerolineae bacterium]
MANNYRVKVQIDIEECADITTDGPKKEDVGTFECEQIVLKTSYGALRDAFACHLSTVSQQCALEVVGSLEECEVKPYRVDGEVGRITFESYWVEQMGENTARSSFPALHAKEWYRTTGFKEVAMAYGTTEKSYRKASNLIDRVRHQKDATPSRTLRENTENEGRQVMAHIGRFCGPHA